MTAPAWRTRVGIALATALTIGLLGSAPAMADDAAVDAASTTAAPPATAAPAAEDPGTETPEPEVPEPPLTLKTTAPRIAGTLAVGATLTAKPGAWTSGTAFAYRWYANGTAISKATSSKLKLTSNLAGKKISVKVTGTKSDYTTASKTSASTVKVITAGSAAVSGTALTGKKLTAKLGTWTAGTKLTYRWYAADAPISGATKSSFTITSKQLGKAVTVKVTGKKSGYATVVKTSKATKKVPRTATPTITGTKKANSTLTAKPGTWSKATTFSYQWYANGKAIKKATSSKLKLTTGYVGKKITVKVTGKKSGYTTASKTSKATAKITYPSRTTPVSSWNCPKWAPIKGNASSMIYHVPGSTYYSRTKPEECFSTRTAAVRAGYRAPLR